MKRNKLKRAANIIRYLDQKMKEKDSDKQVGKTVIQKMIYLLTTRVESVDFDYEMYHYGPFSREISRGLNKAADLGLVEIEWKHNQGYFIKPTSEVESTDVSSKIKKEIDEIVEKYHAFTAVDLSIIATGIYVKQHSEKLGKALIEIVSSLKSKYSKTRIKQLLLETGVLES